MGFPILRYKANLPQWGVWKDALTEEEIEQVIFLEKIIDFKDGLVGQSLEKNDARNSKVSFLEPDLNTEWLFMRLGDIIPVVNYDLFLYDIEAIETIQYTVYEENQHYNWHFDSHDRYLNYERKISGTLLLSSPDEYEGGELEIITGGNPEEPQILKPEKGHIAFFASHMPHRVRPVTKGIRRSLVFWVQGKRHG